VLAELDNVIRAALTEFANGLFRGSWRGREREAVSVFVLGHLAPRVSPLGPIRHATQLAIEAAVPGVEGLNQKGRVNKDLVVWPEARMTLWDKDWNPVNVPVAVLEWKVFRAIHKHPALSRQDLAWLTGFTRNFAGCVGYAVAIDLLQRHFRMRVARAESGVIQEDWLALDPMLPDGATGPT
jgi:hypothetical protein